MEKVTSSVEEIVSYIKGTKEYKTCISLKEKMKDNSDLQELIESVKKTQKKYIRSQYDETIKKELDSLEEKLNTIPIYIIYLENLEKVNEMICYVQDRLNDYFTSLFQ